MITHEVQPRTNPDDDYKATLRAIRHQAEQAIAMRFWRGMILGTFIGSAVTLFVTMLVRGSQ